MSKNIWHKADIAPDPYRSFVINTDKRNIYTGIITNPTEWNPMILPEFYSIGDIDKAERAIRYAYLDDLLALENELDRTRKALEWARHFLKEIRLRYLFEKDEPSRQNKWWDTALYMYNLAEDFLDDYDKTNETKGGDND